MAMTRQWHADMSQQVTTQVKTESQICIDNDQRKEDIMFIFITNECTVEGRKCFI